MCARGCLREKLWSPLNIKQHVSYKEKKCFLFFLSCFSFSNTIEPKGHFIDHSEVMSPVMSLVIYLNVISPSPPLIQSTHLVQYVVCKSGLLLQKADRNEAEPSRLLIFFYLFLCPLSLHFPPFCFFQSMIPTLRLTQYSFAFVVFVVCLFFLNKWGLISFCSQFADFCNSLWFI